MTLIHSKGILKEGKKEKEMEYSLNICPIDDDKNKDWIQQLQEQEKALKKAIIAYESI